MKGIGQKYAIILLFVFLVTNLRSEVKEEGIITFASGSYIKSKQENGTEFEGKNENNPLKEVYIWHDGNEIINTQYHEINEDTEKTNARHHGLRARAKGTVAVNNGKMTVTPLQERILDSSSNVVAGEFKHHVFGGLAYEGAHVINEGEIELTSADITTGRQQIGMGAFDGAQVTNTGTITGSGNAGIYVHGKNALGINEGNIDFIGANGMFADGTQSQVINKGNITNAGANGMNAINGGIAINTETGIIGNKKIDTDKYSGKYGMRAEGIGSEVINYGTIQNEENTGIQVVSGATGINRNIIQNTGLGGMIADGIGSTGINYGTVQNKNKNGMGAQNGATVENRGTIFNTGENGMSANGSGSLAKNYSTIKNTGKYAMVASSEGVAINEGNIEDGGLYTSTNGTVVNLGTITNSKNNSFYIRPTGIGINEGIIKSELKVTSETETIKISDNGYFLNKKDGVIESSGKFAVYVGADATNDSTAEKVPVNMINEGTITITGNGAYGIYSKGKSTAVNKGMINVNGDSSYGMYAIDGSTIINEGTIKINGSKNYGMYATGAGSKIENKGTIILVDGNKVTGNISEEKKDSNNNIAIKLYDNASFVNSGQFKVEGDLDFSSMGDGKFEVSQGGTIEADSIKGNFYASGALTLGSYEDTYSTYRMLKTDKIDGEVKSNSAMFTSKLTEKNENGYYDIIMERRNFNDILNNSSIANALENSYVQGDSNSKKDRFYDALKLLSTDEELNQASEISYGNKIYPTIRKQSFDFIKLNNEKIKSNVLSQINVTGEVRYIGGIDYSVIDQDSSDSFIGYITKAKGIYLGVDKNLNEVYRIGGIINITDINTNFSNYDRREDRMYQGTVYSIYSKNNTNLSSTLFLGKMDGKLNRRVNFSSINENMRGDINSTYFGFTNQLDHKIKLDYFYLKPKAETNLIVLYQKEINEKGEYGLNIQKESNRSFETGIGFDIGKDIKFDNGVKLSLNQGIMYRYEFADTTKPVIAQLKDINEDRVKLSENDMKRNSTELVTKIELTKNDFGIYGEYRFSIGKQDKEMTTLGLTYKY